MTGLEEGVRLIKQQEDGGVDVCCVELVIFDDLDLMTGFFVQILRHM